jgi:hypothetical protein
MTPCSQKGRHAMQALVGLLTLSLGGGGCGSVTGPPTKMPFRPSRSWSRRAPRAVAALRRSTSSTSRWDARNSCERDPMASAGRRGPEIAHVGRPSVSGVSTPSQGGSE